MGVKRTKAVQEVQENAIDAVSEKREEIKEILNDEREFVEPEIIETEVQAQDVVDLEKVFNETKTAIEDGDYTIEDNEEVSEIVEIKKELDEINEKKEELNNVITNNVEKAEEYIKEEIAKAKALKAKINVMANKKNHTFSSYWNGQNFDY